MILLTEEELFALLEKGELPQVCKAQAKKLMKWIETKYKVSGLTWQEQLKDGDIHITFEDWQALCKEVGMDESPDC